MYLLNSDSVQVFRYNIDLLVTNLAYNITIYTRPCRFHATEEIASEAS